jgi:ribosomal protein S18 acetylase RimI-like enzyme
VAAAVCEPLAWDSEFFGRPIARVAGDRLDPGRVAEVLAWCGERAIAGLYFLAAADDPETARLAEDAGFRLVDVRLTLARALGPPPAGDDLAAAGRDAPGAAPAGGPVAIRPTTAADLPALLPIARAAHRDSRFFADPAFPRAASAELYATWLRNSVAGWAQLVLTAELGGSPAGYVTGHLDPGARGRIGLLAVGEAARGAGAGRRLVAGALAWFASQGVADVEVVTQARNVAAQRLYQRAGFTTRAAGLWFHRWFPR